MDRSLYSADGTRIVYRVWGEGDRWLVICNGYGGTFGSWNAIAPLLSPHVRVLVWDYRGQHRSDTPTDRRRLTIDDHLDDLDALLAANGITRFTLLGWSVGVQVALSAWRAHRSRVDGLILMSGMHERVVHNVMGGRARMLMRPTLRAVGRIGPRVMPMVRRALRPALASPRLLPTLDRLGAVRNQPADLPEAIQQFVDLDLNVFVQMVLLADRHETEDWLHQIDVPTLVLAGGKDMLSPPQVMRRAFTRIPTSVYRELPEATHYAVMEYPEVVARHFIEHFARLA